MLMSLEAQPGKYKLAMTAGRENMSHSGTKFRQGKCHITIRGKEGRAPAGNSVTVFISNTDNDSIVVLAQNVCRGGSCIINSQTSLSTVSLRTEK